MDVAAPSATKSSRRPTRKQWVWAAVALLCAALFVGLFGSGLSLAPLGLPAVEVDLAAAQGEGFYFAPDGGIVVSGTESVIVFEELSAETANLRIIYRAVEGGAFPVEMSATLTGDDAMREGDFLADQLTLAPAPGDSEATALLHSNGALSGYRLDFTSVYGQEWVITSLTLNGGGFAFNWGMFALVALGLLLVWVVLVFGLHRPAYDDANPRHRWLARGMAALCALVLAVVFLLGAQAGRRGVMWKYDPALPPAEQVDEYPGTAFYNLLFDAFWNGQLSLRVEPDPALAELSNPYDRSQRGDIPTLWDTSYYNGKYYSYFGPGPVVFYYVFYLVTGHQPSPATACAAAGILVAFLLWAALRQLLIYFKVKPNLLLLMLSIPALVFGSLTAMLVSCADAYAQPYLWAAAGLCGMVWMMYSGASNVRAGGKAWLRRLCWVGAGLCVVMVAACRPAMVLLCVAFAIPVLVTAFFGQGADRPAASVAVRALDMACLATPVLAGAAVLMAYNAARFGSPFEFGQAYQLTVGDMRLQPFRWEPVWLLETLRFYLLQPFTLSGRFPFVEMQSDYNVLFGNRFYNDPFFGLLNLPIYWALLSAPFVLRKNAKPAAPGQDGPPLWARRTLFAGVVCAGVLLWWIDFSIGNFLYRYLCDASFAFALLAVVLLLYWVGTKRQGGVYVIACAVCVVTVALGLLVVFANDRHTIYLNSPRWYVLFDKILRLR